MQLFLRGAPSVTPRKQFKQMREMEERQQRAAAEGKTPGPFGLPFALPFSGASPSTDKQPSPSSASASQLSSELLADTAALHASRR